VPETMAMRSMAKTERKREAVIALELQD